tara:strand:- start:13611 stop:13796 length:186 start_codon:yes stop_codon:yes gene_type:complete
VKYFKKLWKWLIKKTKKKNYCVVEVPMTCNSREDKDDIIISTINHLEQIIKINKKCQKKSM